MENYNDGHLDDRNSIFSLEIDNYGKKTFYDMVKWTKFLAILGFIGVGLMIVLGLFMGALMGRSSYSSYEYSSYSRLGSMYGTIMMLVYVLGAVLYIYPTYALLKYSTCMKQAVTTNDKNKFNEGITYLKNMFKYVGILAIIIIGLYILIIILVMLFAIFSRL